jgi:signal transduction histidine kinase
VKLSNRYNKANIFTAVIILLASSAAYYFIIQSILLQQLDKDLKVEEQEIREYVDKNGFLPKASAYKGQEIRFAVAKSPDVTREVKTTTKWNAGRHQEKPIRVLTFPLKVNGVLYEAIVIKSQVEAEDLLQVIVFVTAGIILVMLVTMYLVNRFLLSKLWQPFYTTLSKLRLFDVKNVKALHFEPTEIDEFNELNSSVSVMTKRINEEFNVLKAFTENASHEMQTPLAIINSKLDILAQHSTEKQAQSLQAIYDSTSRLRRLNQTLLLLTKINNEQFNTHRKLNFKNLVEEKLLQFEEVINSRNLKLNSDLVEINIDMNEELAEILMNNLLSNAIKHNFDNGFISCRLTEQKFTISNSGPALTFDKDHIFNRFQRSTHSTGTGLGLAVVQQICETNNLSIQYHNENNEHAFSIVF